MELSSQLLDHVNTMLSSHKENNGVHGSKVPRILHLGTWWNWMLIFVFLSLFTVEKSR